MQCLTILDAVWGSNSERMGRKHKIVERLGLMYLVCSSWLSAQRTTLPTQWTH